MIFITVAEVDTLLGANWAIPEQKNVALLQANTWLSSKKFCRGIDPVIDDSIKLAAANLALLSSQGMLYVTTNDGTVTEKTVKADTVQVTKKYADGQEVGKSSEMQFIDDLLKPFLCGGVGAINARVCR